MLFVTAEKLNSENDLKIWMNDHLIHLVSCYKYLGVLLDPSLNMKERLQRTSKVLQLGLKF